MSVCTPKEITICIVIIVVAIIVFFYIFIFPMIRTDDLRSTPCASAKCYSLSCTSNKGSMKCTNCMYGENFNKGPITCTFQIEGSEMAKLFIVEE